jgi:hypothetical protein
VQIESLTFFWMTYDEVETIIRRVLAGEFDHATYGTVVRNRPGWLTFHDRLGG